MPREGIRPRVRRAFRLAVRRRGATDADVDAELRFHVEARVEQLVAAGWARGDAEAEARRRFGGSWDDALHTLRRSRRSHDDRLAMRERLETLWHDLRYAARALRRAPRFTLTAALTLALGIGATTAVFSLVDHVVLRPLPYADPERLVAVREVIAEMRDVYPSLPANASHFLEWRRSCQSCEGIAAVRRLPAIYTGGGGDPQQLGAVRTSPSLFALLGARPALGRLLREDDDTDGARVVLLGHAFWRRELGGDPAAVGRTIALNDVPHTVVGVLAPEFALPGGAELGALVDLPRAADVYAPLALTPRERTTPGEYDYAVVARLRPGATLAAARAELAALQQAVGARGPQRISLGIEVVPLQAQVVGGAGRPLVLLLAAVGAVLLIVCVNLAGLALARDAARQREAALRVALGAGRGRLARLALAESLVLALLGGLFGTLLAHWGVRALVAAAPATLPRVADTRLDGRVLGAAALLVVAVALACGALPALRRGRTPPGDALKAGGRTATGGRAAGRRRGAFIAAQVALSAVLLVGTGLFLTSFVRVLGVDKGFAAERVLALDVTLPAARYQTAGRRLQFYDVALGELASLPGVAAAAVTSRLPLEGELQVDLLSFENDPRPVLERPTANIRHVSADYFAAAGTPVRRGRGFTEADRGGAVVVVSERTARALWPGENAVGKRLVPGSNDPASDVIGVAADVPTSSLERADGLVAYVPHWRNARAEASVLVRTTGDPAAVAATARRALRRADPAVPVSKVRTMADVVSASVAARRFQLALLALFAGMALAAAGVGVYGAVSQSLAARAREIGVRMSLGATAGDVRRLVLREGLAPVAAGLAAGVLASLALGRVVAALLFEVRPGDPATIAGVVALLGTVGVAACVFPARRAARVDPAVTLRSE